MKQNFHLEHSSLAAYVKCNDNFQGISDL